MSQGIGFPGSVSAPALFNNQSQADAPGLSPLRRIFQSLKNELAPKNGSGSQTDSLFDDPAGDVDKAFNGAVYQSQVQKIALSAQLKEAAAKIVQAGQGEDGGTSVEAYSKQLAFDFFYESKNEQLAVFQQKAGGTADKLGDKQAAAFRATSERISVRFSLSGSISASSLNGFTNAADGAADSGDGNLVDKLLKSSNELLSQGDEFFNKIFELFDGFLKGDGNINDRLNSLLDGLRELGLVTFGPIGSNQGNAGTPAVQGKQVKASSESFSFQLEFSFQYEKTEVVQESDPIVFDLDNDGVELTSYQDGAQFDITGTGRNTKTAFVTGGDAFLALDRNGNGLIDNGTELFGDQRGSINGFEELRKLDSNNDGVIDKNDASFADLVLFKDNGNGITEDGELISLADAGIESLSLGYRNANQIVAGGNRLAQIASFQRNDGSRGLLADAVLNFTA